MLIEIHNLLQIYSESARGQRKVCVYEMLHGKRKSGFQRTFYCALLETENHRQYVKDKTKGQTKCQTSS